MTQQPNRAGRPWQRKDGRWSGRAYPPGQPPKVIYGRSEEEVMAKQQQAETGEAPWMTPLAPVAATPAARPPKPIRVTIDLDQNRYRTLQAFRGKQITAAAVFRAFLDELDESNELAARISARIWAGRR